MTIELTPPHEVRVVEVVHHNPSVFTLRIAFTDRQIGNSYRFQPGQFNMVYLPGVGEVAISIVSDPDADSESSADPPLFDHTIRAVGRVTRGLRELKAGDHIGLRGPYGRGWPLVQAKGHDVVIITGGLGCAPVVSAINYIAARRSDYGRLTILQGVKLPKDLIWRERFEQWVRLPNTQVYLAADKAEAGWPWHVGLVTELFDQMSLGKHSLAMICGPEGMMRACVHELQGHGIDGDHIFLSLERNMQCATGHCGHCQYGPHFICRNGPVYQYSEIADLFGRKGI